MLKYFLGNNVISPKQSGFHDIFTSFDKGLEVRRVFGMMDLFTIETKRQ